jgi:hypothetical protein
VCKNIHRQLVGAWKLISISGHGYTVNRLGKAPIGLLVYDASGNMAAQIMRSDRPSVVPDNLEQADAADIKLACEGYLAYFGTYEVDEHGNAYHHVTGNLFPNDVSRTFERKIEFLEGDRIVITATGRFAGDDLSASLVWEKLAL